MARVVQSVPAGMTALLAAVLIFRAAHQPLSPGDWALVMAFGGVVGARAAAATKHPIAAAISCTFVYVLKLLLIDILRRLQRLSERDAQAMRKRIKSCFKKDLCLS